MSLLAEQLLLGLAAVVHTVLLLVVIERSNRPLTAVWLKLSLAGATLWHVAAFFHILLRPTSGQTAAALDVLCMIVMVSGLLLLNSGVLHAALRIHHSGAVMNPPRNLRFTFLYLPLLLLPWIGFGIAGSDSRDFLAATRSWHGIYLCWLTAANLVAARLFVRNRRVFAHQTAPSFFVKFALSLVVLTVVVDGYVMAGASSRWEPFLRIITSISPMLPTTIFAWYVFRRRLLPMVFERTLAYGAILLAVLYLHRLTITPLMDEFAEQVRFDLVLVEGLLLLSLVLAYHPLRNRVREGLRYLLDSRVAVQRDATRQLSVDLTRKAVADIAEITEWFAAELRRSLDVEFVRVDLVSPVSHSACSGSSPTGTDVADFDVFTAKTFVQSDRWLDRSRCTNETQLELLRQLDLMAAFPMQYEAVRGQILLGLPTSADRLTDEQLNSTLMLVDQFAAVLQSRHLDQVRQSAERHALQQEKLSVLGLLSGSLAHELKNPLSSIRTIATLLKEDLPAESEAVHEVELILSEIDRLTETTGRLLDFARPVRPSTRATDPDQVILRLLKILTHLARQHDVSLHHEPNKHPTQAAIAEAELNDILFNLIRNAIEAVRGCERREVRIRCSDGNDDETVCIQVVDSGAGVPQDLQSQIFQPFVTEKSDGTGLGLYLVAQRIREVEGSVHCHSEPGRTVFEVILPRANANC
ncbi:MAG: hypothetical protein Fues2KO_45410 [Fuerstiella sp.]